MNIAPVVGLCLACILLGIHASAQQTANSTWVPVRPIEPPDVPLPSEAASSGVTRFSFIAYGDTRSSVDGQDPQPEHGALVDLMIAKAKQLASTPFPIRFVLQSGDAATNGSVAVQWNASFTPVIEKLIRGARLPYFFTVGNHDVTTRPAGDPARAAALHNTLSAISRLIPPEGSPRRLNGYPTYAFGYGNLFAMAIDSQIAADPTQLAWVTDQLERLDRERYRHVMVFFHHPLLSSGPHGGASPGPSANGNDSVEPQTAALRRLYAPLFRKSHVRMTITGHDHLHDHWVERYTDQGRTYRIDHLVTGGGGAPIYTYRGEPDVDEYVRAGGDQNIRLQHIMRPGTTAAQNPHHFLVIQVDEDRLSVEAVASGGADYRPYGGQARAVLNDR